jgi:hypothetical protein
VKPIKLLRTGHTLPNFRWAISHNLIVKRFEAYVLFDAVRDNSSGTRSGTGRSAIS